MKLARRSFAARALSISLCLALASNLQGCAGMSGALGPVASVLGPLIGAEIVEAKIKSIIGTAEGAVKNSLIELDARLRDVIDKGHALFGDDFSHITRELSETEKKFLVDVQAVVGKADLAANEVIKNGDKAAKEVIFEANIAAYDALYSIPFRVKVPRIVYATPESIRETGDWQRVTLRGNFLNLAAPTVSAAAEGFQVAVLAVEPNGIALNIKSAKPSDSVKQIAVLNIVLQGEDFQACRFLFFACETQRPRIQSQSAIEIQPRTKAQISVTITGQGRRSERQVFAGHVEGCVSVWRKDCVHLVAVPAGWEIAHPIASNPGAYMQFPSTWGSGIDSLEYAGNSGINVRYHSQGCIGFLGISCGNGYLNIDYSIPATRRVDFDLSPQSFARELQVPNRTESFRYALLAGNEEFLSLAYEVSVSLTTGEIRKASSASPTVPGLRTNYDRLAGIVSVELDY